MKKQIVRLTENDIHRIVRESINEISRRKAMDVSENWGDVFKDLKNKFNDFYAEITFYYGHLEDENKYIRELIGHAKAINDILERKINQAEEIEDAAYEQDFDEWASQNPDYTGDEEYYDSQI